MDNRPPDGPVSPRNAPTAAATPLPTTAPARRVARPRWTDTRLLLGVLLVLASVVVGSRVVASAQQTRPVWAAARELPVGSVVRVDDLVVAQVRLADSATRYLPVAGRPPTGMVVARPVGAGELVPAEALTQSPDQPSAHLVSVPVEVLHYPPGLGRGDVVDVFVSAADGAESPSIAGDRGPQRVLADATVVEVDDPGERLGGGGTAAAVVLSVPDGEVPAVIAAIRSGAVDLVLVERPGAP